MWSNSPFLLTTVQFERGGWLFRMPVPLALYTVSGFLLSLEGLLTLIPGENGRWLRNLSDKLYALLWEFQGEGPQELLSVRLREREGAAWVRVRTLGWHPCFRGARRLFRSKGPSRWGSLLWRLAACMVSLLAVGLVQGGSPARLLGAGILLFLLFLLVRPAVLLLLLPVQAPLAGVLTPAVDALLSMGACALWGIPLEFLPGLGAGAAAALLSRPLAYWKRRRGIPV